MLQNPISWRGRYTKIETHCGGVYPYRLISGGHNSAVYADAILAIMKDHRVVLRYLNEDRTSETLLSPGCQLRGVAIGRYAVAAIDDIDRCHVMVFEKNRIDCVQLISRSMIYYWVLSTEIRNKTSLVMSWGKKRLRFTTLNLDTLEVTEFRVPSGSAKLAVCKLSESGKQIWCFRLHEALGHFNVTKLELDGQMVSDDLSLTYPVRRRRYRKACRSRASHSCVWYSLQKSDQDHSLNQSWDLELLTFDENTECLKRKRYCFDGLGCMSCMKSPSDVSRQLADLGRRFNIHWKVGIEG